MGHINTKPQPNDGWVDEQSKRLTRLVAEMGNVLGYKLQQLDVLDGGYWPQGFVDLEVEWQEVRRALIAVFSGHRPLMVSQANPAPPPPFPPPPPPTQ